MLLTGLLSVAAFTALTSTRASSLLILPSCVETRRCVVETACMLRVKAPNDGDDRLGVRVAHRIRNAPTRWQSRVSRRFGKGSEEYTLNASATLVLSGQPDEMMRGVVTPTVSRVAMSGQEDNYPKRTMAKTARTVATETAAMASEAAETTAQLWDAAEELWTEAKAVNAQRVKSSSVCKAYGRAAYEARLHQETEDELRRLAAEASAEADRAGDEATVSELSQAGTSLLNTLLGAPKSAEETEQARRDRHSAAGDVVPESASPDGVDAATTSGGSGGPSDDELRRQREEAQAMLKARRPKKLSESVAHSALNAALAAAEAAGASLEWAEGQREKALLASKMQAKTERLALFSSDLALLGIPLEEAGADLSEATLRRAFRARSRVLHPDARVAEDTEEDDDAVEQLPSVYELNAAFEAVKKLL